MNIKVGDFVSCSLNNGEKKEGMVRYVPTQLFDQLLVDYISPSSSIPFEIVHSYEKLVTKIEDPQRIKELSELRRGFLMKDSNKFSAYVGKGNGPFIGADPEVFAISKNGEVIPAWEFLPSTKEKGGDQVFWDGVQGEFNIQATYCHSWVVDYIQAKLQIILNRLREKFPDSTLTHKPVVDLSPSLLEGAKEEHIELGCAPSLNAYGLDPVVVDCPRALPFRFAGFHIHYGKLNSYCDGNMVERVKGIDRVFGIISVALLRGLEDSRRRMFYGRAGEYRLPKHGLEYRVPSSAMLYHPILTHLCLDLARMSGNLVDKRLIDEWKVEGGEQEVQHIINRYDVDGALNVIKNNDNLLNFILYTLYNEKGTKVKKLITNGAISLLPNVPFESAWQLTPKGQRRQWVTHSAGDDECVTTSNLF